MKRKNKIPKKVYLISEDMTYFTTITKDGSREPTKWEVLRVAFFRFIYFSRGKGLLRKLLTSFRIRFVAAPWKASHASWENVRKTAPEPSLSVNDTE